MMASFIKEGCKDTIKTCRDSDPEFPKRMLKVLSERNRLLVTSSDSCEELCPHLLLSHLLLQSPSFLKARTRAVNKICIRHFCLCVCDYWSTINYILYATCIKGWYGIKCIYSVKYVCVASGL